jgi:hypothetical protein
VHFCIQEQFLNLHFFEQFFNMALFWCKFQNCSKFGQLKLHDLQIVIFTYLHTTPPQPPPTTTEHTTLQNPIPPNASQAKSKSKALGKSGQRYLFDLIRTGDVDITNASYINIKDIQETYFDHRDVKNFHCIFAILQPLLTSRPNTAVQGNAKQV